MEEERPLLLGGLTREKEGAESRKTKLQNLFPSSRPRD